MKKGTIMSKKAIMRKVGMGVLMLGMILATVGCSANTEKEKIVVGSKSFTEGNILSELYALALEQNGFEVERKFNIAGSVIHQAIVSEEIDVYPEYTGTALLSVLKLPVMTDEKEVYELVSKEYKEQFNLTMLNYSPMNDGQGLVLRTDVAQKYGIKTISDLQKHADNIRFASQGDFDEREDGIPALEKVYGPFEFASSVVYDESLKYDVLKSNEADLTVAYTTEGALRDKAFTLLVDDGRVWPPYNAVPVIRTSVLENNPKVAEVLNALSAQITTEDITILNAKVDLDKEEIEEVAAEYFNTIKDKVTVQ